MPHLSDSYVLLGCVARSQRTRVDITYAMEDGLITDRGLLRRLLRSIFEDELRVDPTGRTLHLVLPALTSQAHRQELAEMIFDDFGAAGLKFRLSSYCSLKATARNSGIVLNSGETVTEVVPFLNDVCLEAGILRWQTDLSGRGVSKSLRSLVQDNSGTTFDLDNNTGLEMMRELRINFGYVALNYDEELHKLCNQRPDDPSIRVTHTNAEGVQVTLGEERFQIGESLFNPGIVNKPGIGLPQLVLDAVESAAQGDGEVRKTLLQTIVLAGGNTMMTGFADRLRSDLARLAGEEVKVVDIPWRNHNSWTGASILSMEDETTPMTRDEWQTTRKAPECM